MYFINFIVYNKIKAYLTSLLCRRLMYNGQITRNNRNTSLWDLRRVRWDVVISFVLEMFHSVCSTWLVNYRSKSDFILERSNCDSQIHWRLLERFLRVVYFSNSILKMCLLVSIHFISNNSAGTYFNLMLVLLLWCNVILFSKKLISSMVIPPDKWMPDAGVINFTSPINKN